jgi:5-methylcytosine-specific restriction endonuclease McrA
MNNKLKSKYKAKAKDSFKTKKNMFLFQAVINNKSTLSKPDFNDFSISEKLVHLYSSEYWQQPMDYRINELKISEIEEKIKLLESENIDLLNKLEVEYIEDIFSSKFPEAEFENLLNQKTCHYCGISIDDIEKLGNSKKLYKKTLRGWNLEIDRLNSNFEYTPDNCVMCCYWCNNAKTDEFTETEFLKIGKEIKKIWEERLK